MIPQGTADTIITQWLEITRLMRQKMVHSHKGGMGMNPMHVHALMVIREHDGMTMTEFAKLLRITTPSATSFINRLVNMKWVKRTRDAKNRKLVRLHLSKEGQKTFQTKMHQHTKVMRDLFALLSTADQRSFSRILGTLRATLAAHTKS